MFPRHSWRTGCGTATTPPEDEPFSIDVSWHGLVVEVTHEGAEVLEINDYAELEREFGQWDDRDFRSNDPRMAEAQHHALIAWRCERINHDAWAVILEDCYEELWERAMATR